MVYFVISSWGEVKPDTDANAFKVFDSFSTFGKPMFNQTKLPDNLGAITEYPSTIVFLKRHPLKNEAYLFICKLVDGYSVILALEGRKMQLLSKSTIRCFLRFQIFLLHRPVLLMEWTFHS